MAEPQEYNLTKPAYSISEIINMLPIGRTKINEAIKDGSLRVTRNGKKRMLLAPDIVVFLEKLRKRSG